LNYEEQSEAEVKNQPIQAGPLFILKRKPQAWTKFQGSILDERTGNGRCCLICVTVAREDLREEEHNHMVYVDINLRSMVKFPATTTLNIRS
jgi:hypothetical protein